MSSAARVWPWSVSSRIRRRRPSADGCSGGASGRAPRCQDAQERLPDAQHLGAPAGGLRRVIDLATLPREPGRAIGMDHATRDADTAFAELIRADAQWLREEFDALIAASFSQPPPRTGLGGGGRHGRARTGSVGAVMVTVRGISVADPFSPSQHQRPGTRPIEMPAPLETRSWRFRAPSPTLRHDRITSRELTVGGPVLGRSQVPVLHTALQPLASALQAVRCRLRRQCSAR
jgi:hypothetical protein